MENPDERERIQQQEIQNSNDEIDEIFNNSLTHFELGDVHDPNVMVEKYCWVCFATDVDEAESGVSLEWTKPCKCKGTLRWVHQLCLQRWVDEKQKGNTFRRVLCQQCQTEYIIVLPSMGLLANVLEAMDTITKRSSPFLAAGVFIGSLYWTAVTYGAITVLQVLGHNDGLEILEASDHIFLMVALPAIPVILILGRMIRWEDYVLRYLQNRHRKNYPLLSLILPTPDDDRYQDDENNPPIRNNIPSDTLSTTRVLCGALLLPSISSIIGKTFFSNIKNNLHRTLLGGLTFIAIKGVFKIYFKQSQFIRKKQRKIVDYTDENIFRYQHNRLPNLHE